MKPGDEILIRAKLINVRESDNEVTVGFDSTTTAVVPLGAVEGQDGAEVKLFDLVAETREKLRPFIVMETFKTGTVPATYLAVDIILQEAFERVAAPSLHKEGVPTEETLILREALQTIADFAVGHGDVCEIIAKRARHALTATPAALHKEGAGGAPTPVSAAMPTCGQVDQIGIGLLGAATDAPKETQ